MKSNIEEPLRKRTSKEKKKIEELTNLINKLSKKLNNDIKSGKEKINLPLTSQEAKILKSGLKKAKKFDDVLYDFEELKFNIEIAKNIYRSYTSQKKSRGNKKALQWKNELKENGNILPIQKDSLPEGIEEAGFSELKHAKMALEHLGIGFISKGEMVKNLYLKLINNLRKKNKNLEMSSIKEKAINMITYWFYNEPESCVHALNKAGLKGLPSQFKKFSNS